MGPSTPPPLCGCPRGGDWRKTPRLPPVSVFPLSLAIFHLSTVIPAFSRPWAPPRYPTPNLSPEPREIELVQISEASRKERPQVLIPPLGGGTRRQKPPPVCPDGPSQPRWQCVMQTRARTDPMPGPVRVFPTVPLVWVLPLDQNEHQRYTVEIVQA